MTLASGCLLLIEAGRQDLVDGIWRHYDRVCEDVGPFQAGSVLPMFDHLLDTYMLTDDPVSCDDVLLSADFAPVKALARQIQAIEEPTIELTEEDVS